MAKQRQFDDQEVLGRISDYFWKHGYSATKVDQLSEITGLTKTSLYNAFGNKEALFLHSMDFYVEHTLLPSLYQLDTDRPLSENLAAVFAHYFTPEQNQQLDQGCLLTNCLLELAANEPRIYQRVATHFATIREGMLGFTSVYADTGRLAAGVSAEDVTDLIMTFLQGLRVQSRNPQPVELLQRSVDLFLALVRSVERNDARAA